MSQHLGAASTLGQLLAEVEDLLKTHAVGMELGRRGINTSVALVATQGLAAYLQGDKRRAMEDLATAAEEIRARLERG
jgi:hypothetical protein